MRAKILNLLRDADTLLSGESLSGSLGVSRVSVWKHIRKLQEAGYAIAASSQGYRLVEEPDLPYAWEFTEGAAKVHYLPEIASTMDEALTMARQGAPHLTVVVAGRQTNGRGRLIRQWNSTDGGLYFTLVLRPHLHPAYASRMTFLTGVVLARTIQEAFDLPAKVKWPNDLLIHEQKVAGMLAQMEAEGDTLSFINIGIGLNVNNDPSAAVPLSTSLGKELGRRLSRKNLLRTFLERLETRLAKPLDETIITEWKRHTVTLGRQVEIVTTRETVRGLAEDVDVHGGLRLRLFDGTATTVVHGDCFHHPSSGQNTETTPNSEGNHQ
jgi:BirA family transcriptional regulator, biotin operon repressor / biotin---[acetyl-CoA-carboxylase] ligase